MKKNYFVLTLFLSLFAVSAIAQPTVVNTQNLSLDVFAKSNYDMDLVQFDLSQTLTDLGVDSVAKALPVAIAADGSYTNASNEGSGGFFIGSADTVANWAAGGVVYITHFGVDEGYVGVGQFPDSLEAYIDQSLTFTYGFQVGDNIELLKITLNISEIPPIEGTIINTQELTLHIQPNNDYVQDSIQFDLDQTLTDLDIGELSEATVIAIDDEGAYTDSYNADGGFWINRQGIVAGWGAGAVVWISTMNWDDGWLGVGYFPDSIVIGDVVNAKYAFIANEKIEMLDVTVKAVNVGVDQKEADSHSIMSFANPVQDELRVAVSANEIENATLTVYSITGAKVYSKNNISTIENIDLGHIASGVYFLNFDNGIKRETMKFIKQ